MMSPKAMLLILIIGVMLAQEAHGISHLKLKLLKAKAIAAKAPHIAAKVAVAKEIKVKSGIAFAKSVAALKASKAAALSVITAPIRVAKKTIAYKVGALKAAKALKIAKVAVIAGGLAKLKKHPIIVPVPVPFKLPSFGFKHDALKVAPLAIGAGALAGKAAGAAVASGPVHGLISGATNFIKSAGIGGLPFFPAPPPPPVAPVIPVPEPQIIHHTTYVQAPAPEPIYRFIPNAEVQNYNHVHYSPHINVEVPSHDGEHSSGSGSAQVTAPHSDYGVPSQF